MGHGGQDDGFARGDDAATLLGGRPVLRVDGRAPDAVENPLERAASMRAAAACVELAA